MGSERKRDYTKLPSFDQEQDYDFQAIKVRKISSPKSEKKKGGHHQNKRMHLQRFKSPEPVSQNKYLIVPPLAMD